MIQQINDIGEANDGTAAVSGGTAVVAIASPIDRQAVNICNHGAYDMWYKLTKSGATAPTITSTSKTGVIEAGKELTLAAAKTVQIWLISSNAANTVAFTATEWR